MDIVASLKYLKITIIHKWFVFKAGYIVAVPFFRLLTHDWSKFLPSQFIPYGQHFYGNKKNVERFNEAWLKHQKIHDHHWEHWIGADGKPIAMEYEAIQEMVADWIGASRAYSKTWPTKERWEWFENNVGLLTQRIHPVSMDIAMFLIDHYFEVKYENSI